MESHDGGAFGAKVMLGECHLSAAETEVERAGESATKERT